MHKSAPVLKVSLGICMALSLSACSLAPEYQTPNVSLPIHWQAEAESSDKIEPASEISGWQEFVTDAGLRQLVEVALSNNRDLKRMLLNVEAARAQYGFQKSQQLPHADVVVSSARQRLPGNLVTPGAEQLQSLHQAGIGLASFELDLFGRVANLSEVALQEYFAASEGANSLTVSLVADVILAYLNYNSVLQREVLAEQIKAVRAITQQQVEQRLHLGAASKMDYQQASEMTLKAEMTLTQIRREKQLLRNSLSLLSGVNDVSPYLPDAPRFERLLVQDVAAGTPSEILIKRPDIRAAEHRLKGRNANIGAARAAFFPTISLTGMFGTASTEIDSLFATGQRSWSFMPQLTLPIFDAGRNQSNLDLALVQKDMAIVDYENAIQRAFRDVSDALAIADTLKQEENIQRELSFSKIETLMISQARYQAGADDYLQYLSAQSESFADAILLIEIENRRQLALVGLFRALGGNWYSPVLALN